MKEKKKSGIIKFCILKIVYLFTLFNIFLIMSEIIYKKIFDKGGKIWDFLVTLIEN